MSTSLRFGGTAEAAFPTRTACALASQDGTLTMDLSATGDRIRRTFS